MVGQGKERGQKKGRDGEKVRNEKMKVGSGIRVLGLSTTDYFMFWRNFNRGVVLSLGYCVCL